ncbi:MAG TPA: helicase C-terminal domain-containing protein [Planctomycetota bacterium]|jgi:Rad3-related DNA helicase
MPQALVEHPVYLTLVTSEPAGEGTLVRISAERDVSGETKSFDHFVRGERLTLAQSRLTGITNTQLDRGFDLDVVLQDLVEFSEGSDGWLVADGPPARLALQLAAARAGFPGRLGPPVVGLEEVEAIVWPSSLPHKDGSVRERWEKAEPRLLSLPLPLIAEMNWLLTHADNPLKKLLKRVESLAMDEQFGKQFSSGRLSLEALFKDFSPIIARLKPDGDETPVDEVIPIELEEPVEPEEVAGLLGPSGPLAKALSGYEERPEQIAMARRVGEILSAGKHLLSEAGTGVGKSLAYLVPAILFARRAGRPVMVSTHTKNLQSQLFEKDLPFLREHLGIEFSAALLRGRPNYLCLRKFMYTLQEASHELDDEERAQLLPIMSWALQTESGDVGELEAFSPEKNLELWDRLHTIGEDCLSRNCPFFKRCFLYKARALTRGVEIVVLNHALVFAELNTEAGTLPPYQEIVFDEAHKLEDVATEHLATEVTPRRLYRILNRLYRISHGSSAGKGLLSTLLAGVEQARTAIPQVRYEAIRDHILNTMQAISPANEGSDSFFETVREWTEKPAPSDDEPMQPYVPRERGRGGLTFEPNPDEMPAQSVRPKFGQPMRRKNFKSSDERKRFSATTLYPDDAELFKAGKEAAISRLGILRQSLEVLAEDFKEIKKHPVPRTRELATEINAQSLFLEELIGDIEFIVKGDEPNYVYWCEPWGRKGARVVAAPLDVSKLLYDQLYEKKRSIVFTSATMSLRDVAAGDQSGLSAYLPPLPHRAANLTPRPPSLEGKGENGSPPLIGEGLGDRLSPHPKSFEFVKQRLGLSFCTPEKLEELLLGSPFDYDAQCRCYVPMFIPEPAMRERDFDAQFASMAGELVIASGGRAMILYTSYAALQASAKLLQKMLRPEAIEVLVQGDGQSREMLLQRLKEGGRSVLLGTASFWEGVDVRGEALSLLIIAKLPFAVFTDPIVQGRCELLEASGKDAFLHFSVPNAILRLRQGFGRLIRSKSDRGVVVIGDKRVVTKRYGPAFLRALPAHSEPVTSQDALVREVRDFLGSGG